MSSRTSIASPPDDDKIVTQPRRRPTVVRYAVIGLKFVLAQWQILGIGIAVLLAYLFPDVGRRGGVIESQYTISYGAIGIIFLVSGLSIPRKALIDNATKWRLHLVTQITSYLIFSSLVFGIVSIIKASGTDKIDLTIMVGLIVMGCIPTTISSNVVMTRAAKGNDSATLIEVTIGNVLGPFLSPALTRMYLTSSSAYEGLVPGVDGVGQLYADVFKQLGCAMFAPFFVGQLIQLSFPKQANWAMTKLYLNKVGSVCLLFVIWATFSSCFYYQALESVSHQSVILVCFLNVGLYVFFTLFSLLVARPPLHPRSRIGQKVFWRFPKRDTIAICFCAPAKSVSIGAPLIGVMWGASFSGAVQSLVMVPIVLYQAEQILCGQIMVRLFRRWARDEWMTQPVVSDEETATEETSVPEREENEVTSSEVKLEIHSEGEEKHDIYTIKDT